MSGVDEIEGIAKSVARGLKGFEKRRGPGRGNRATNRFMNVVKSRVGRRLGTKCTIEAPVGGGTDYRFDFYLPDEDTAVEMAFSIRKSPSEFEKDIFKALLATEDATPVKRLVFLSKSGTKKKRGEPGPRAIIQFVKSRFGLSVEVREITGG